MSGQTKTHSSIRDEGFERDLSRRKRLGEAFMWVCLFATLIGIVALLVLLVDVATQAMGWLTPQFLTSYPSRFPERAGILSSFVGSIYMMLLVALFAFPIGVGAAIYLEEYNDRGWLSTFIEVNIANLAGVPSIVYGLLGLVVFVRFLGLGRSLLAGALTMTLLILPIIIIASREAIRAVPLSIRQAAYGLGATRWQVIQSHVLPLAFPGILTGTILALSRAIGETAPLITIGALTFIAFLPDSLLAPFSVMPIQIFNWTSRPQADFQHVAAAGIVLLLIVLLTMNSIAIWLRYRWQKKVTW
jgi:phosphate transport system permease protein